MNWRAIVAIVRKDVRDAIVSLRIVVPENYTGDVIGDSPFMDSLIVIITIIFFVAGLAYGRGAGTIELAIPRLREGSYFPQWLLSPRKRSEHRYRWVEPPGRLGEPQHRDAQQERCTGCSEEPLGRAHNRDGGSGFCEIRNNLEQSVRCRIAGRP